MERLTAFVTEHIGDDTTRLIMNRAKWPEIDMDMAVNCIESRRKLKGKVQEWCDEPRLIFPRKLSAEQCSSSATGKYKAELAANICTTYLNNSRNSSAQNTVNQIDANQTDGTKIDSKTSFRLADLTGGLGVDSWFFSKKAARVMYCEMLPELCKAAEHNFSILGAANIQVCNVAVCDREEISFTIAQATSSVNRLGSLDRNDDIVISGESEKRGEISIFQSATQILADFHPDIVYMDPARRGEGGKKVFLIEDCTPDVLTLKDEIFLHTRHILLKLSPMADITMVCERLGRCCREVHVVAAVGECKELLIWMDREWNDDYIIHAVELHKDGDAGVFSFNIAEEKNASSLPQLAMKLTNTDQEKFLFEPGKALMKAGAFNLVSDRFQISKLGRSTHYYIFSDSAADTEDGTESNPSSEMRTKCHSKALELKQYGKVFRIIRIEPLDKRTIKAAGKEFPKAEVTARNIPMDTDTLRKKLGVISGDDAHIFGLKSDSSGMLLLICSALR